MSGLPLRHGSDDLDGMQDLQDLPYDSNDLQDASPEEHDNILGIPLHKLQRRWGIGDRKTRDGQPAKRRGPKPDSKPAITRRQEMNRVAQRTHRERKENYMHDLEDAFLALRQRQVQLAEENKKLSDQNQYLKQRLAAHNISVDLSSPNPSSYGGAASGFSPRSLGGFGSDALSTGSSRAASSLPISHPSPPFPQPAQPATTMQQHQMNPTGIDLQNVAMQFVGTYGRTPYLSPPPNL